MKNTQITAATTRREAISSAANRLAQDPQLRDSATRDAELLLLYILDVPRSHLLAYPDRDLTPEQLQRYDSAIRRRLTHEPIQYITGTQEFYGLPLHVTPAVLIPRPETEVLVEAVLALLPHSRPLRILDVGTGSGAIAIAIARHLPQAHVTGLDISTDALGVADHNAHTHGVDLRLLHSDLLTAVQGETFDAILSNPPYVPTSDHATLHPQVREHEPHAALFAGPTGLDIYTRLIPAAHAALAPGGLLALEIGHGQNEAIEQLLCGWNDISFVKDLQLIPRIALARKSPAVMTQDESISSSPEHNMPMKQAQLQNDLYTLEERLLHPDREPDRALLVPLLAEDFKEFCTSGRIFNRAQTIEAILTSAPRSATISHFSVTPLADGVVLATYHATTMTSVSHRASIWVRRGENWQLLFHQGTVAI